MNKEIDEKGEGVKVGKLYLFQDDYIKGKNNLSFSYHSLTLFSGKIFLSDRFGKSCTFIRNLYITSSNAMP